MTIEGKDRIYDVRCVIFDVRFTPEGPLPLYRLD